MSTLSLLPTGTTSSAIYVFLLLQWLLVAPHSIEELQQCYEAHPWCNKRISDDSIRLYLNTLRELGCQIERPTLKNHYRYQLLMQSFTLTNPKATIALLIKLFNSLEASTDMTVILQRYTAMKTLLAYSGVAPSQWEEQLPFMAEHAVALKTLISYTQQAAESFKSFQVTYTLPQYDKTKPKKTETLQNWTVIPLAILQEKGRLYWLVWEVVADQSPQWVQRMLRYDRLLSVEPLVLPNNIQQYFEAVTANYFKTLPLYRFVITCPIGVNFAGLGFPQEQVWVCAESQQQLEDAQQPLPTEIFYEYCVQTDFTFLLQQRLFALVGFFTVIEAPQSFRLELEAWNQQSLAHYQ